MQEFLTKGSLGEVQAGQVISFGAGLLVAQHQLTSVAAAKTLVLRLLPPFAFPLFVLSLPSLGFGLGCVAIGVLQEEKGCLWTPKRHPNIQNRYKAQVLVICSPLVGHPGNRCSSERRSSTPFSRCRDSPGYS